MRSLLFFLLISGTFSAIAEPNQNTVSEKNYRIGVLYWSMNIPGQVAMRQGLEQAAKKINSNANIKPTIELIPRVAGDDHLGIERQVEQMRELIKLNVDLIIVQPTDNAALGEPLREANKAGIPVVAYDQYISGGQLTSYITSDNYQAGYLGGEYVSSLFPPGKRILLVLVEYPHVSSTVERVDGFLDALRDCNRAYVIRKTYLAVEPKQGKKAGQEILRDFPDTGSIDVIFTVNDGGGLAVYRELMAAKRNEIIGITIDGDPDAVELIKKGSIIKNDSAQFCGVIGETALRIAYDFLKGKPAPEQVLIPVFPVNQTTINAYQNWTAPLPPAFKKTWTTKDTYWNPQLKYRWKNERKN